MTEVTYLFAHTSIPRNDEEKRSDIAQAEVVAATQTEAEDTFAMLHPERMITKVGIKGVEE